jgi:hypothetical protein
MNILPVNTQAQAYRLLKFESSRWAAGLPLPYISFENFSYSGNSSLFYDDGKRGRDNTGVWQPAESGNISTKVQRGSRNNPLYFVVETKNKSLSAGHYKLDYEIIPEAKTTPDWVRDLNAPDISALRESVRSGAEGGGGIKVLELLNVYRKIAEAYNKTNPRIHADRLYLTKR